MSAPQADLHGLPSKVGRYELIRVLGTGGMGRIVLAWDPVLRRQVAIKLVEPSGVQPQDMEELCFMFHREARTTAQLRHPNIIEVYDYSGSEASLMYLVCEFVEAPTLADILHKHGSLAPALVAALGYELCQALHAAHSQDVVHRDLKPENIFWCPTGRIVLGDFGIAKVFSNANVRLGHTVVFGATNLYGSPAFMAPEQLQDSQASPASDLFSLGALLYECLTGEQAHQGAHVDAIIDSILRGPPVEVPNHVACPASLKACIQALLKKDPHQRPHDASRVAAELRAVLDELRINDPRLLLRNYGETQSAEAQSDTTSPAPKAARPGKARSRRLTLLALLGIGGAFVAAAALQQHSFPHPEVSSAAPPGKPSPDTITAVVRFPGSGVVFLNNKDVAHGTDEVEITIAPGRHRLEVRIGSRILRKVIAVLPNTQPIFDFTLSP